MKNKEKYPKTEDATKAYYLYRGKQEAHREGLIRPISTGFFDWLDLEAEEPEKPALKPCPFCGGTNIEINRLAFSNTVSVACRDCRHHLGYVVKTLGDTEAEAIANWNKRA